MQSPSLPDVYDELEGCLFHGSPLVVKNTFVDFDSSPSIASASKKRLSLQILPFSRLLTADEAAEQLASTTPLHEVRIRAFSSMSDSGDECSDWGAGCSSISSDASTCAPSDCNSLHSVTSCGSDASSESPRWCEPLRSCLMSSDKCKSAESPCLPSFFDSNCESPGSDSVEEAGTTTFMIRSLPHSTSRTTLEQVLDAEGFAGQYDFIYLPVNLKARECYGYGFVNLVSVTEARRFVKHFHGYSGPHPDQEPIGVHASEGLEGLDALIERYRNSPLMHSSVPEEFRPAIYRDGVMVSFPSPTLRLRAPRKRL